MLSKNCFQDCQFVYNGYYPGIIACLKLCKRNFEKYVTFNLDPIWDHGECTVPK